MFSEHWSLLRTQSKANLVSIDNMLYFLPSSDGLVCVESPSAIMPGRRMVAAAEYMFTRRFLYTHIVPDCPHDITFCIQYCREFHLITLHYWSSKTWTRSLHQRSLLTPWHLLTTINKELLCIIAIYWHFAIKILQAVRIFVTAPERYHSIFLDCVIVAFWKPLLTIIRF